MLIQQKNPYSKAVQGFKQSEFQARLTDWRLSASKHKEAFSHAESTKVKSNFKDGSTFCDFVVQQAKSDTSAVEQAVNFVRMSNSCSFVFLLLKN